MKLLSIIIPVLNDENVFEAINSISKNDSTEIIVIDGKSEDALVDRLKNNDKIDILISEKDKGFYDAVNKGVNIANGKWIFVLAADDILLTDITQAIDKFDDDTCELICGSVLEKLGEDEYRFNYSSSNLDDLRYESSIRHPASIFRKDIFSRYGYYDTNYRCAGDREIFLRFYLKGAQIKVVKECFTLFNFGGMSTRRPIYWYIKEELKISDKYKTSKVKSRAILLKIIINTYGHKIKDFLGIKHHMKIYSRDDAMSLISKGD